MSDTGNKTRNPVNDLDQAYNTTSVETFLSIWPQPKTLT
jgi:hypothetical protein